MIVSFSDVSWIGFAIAVVASVVLAGVYYGAIIAKPYLRALGRDVADVPPSDLVRNVGPIVCIVITVFTTALLEAMLDLTTVDDAVQLGLIIGVGYLVAMTFQIALNPNFPHPIRYALLNAPFFVVSSLVTSLALVLV